MPEPRIPLQPNQVVVSNLFKAMAPYINSISNAQLVYELCRASTTTEVRIHRYNMDSCMVWADTPQKYPFWVALNEEHQHNARANGERVRYD